VPSADAHKFDACFNAQLAEERGKHPGLIHDITTMVWKKCPLASEMRFSPLLSIVS
jgi:hypothetical protein